VAAQILGLGAFDSTNSAQIIGTVSGICAVMGGASVTPAPPKFNLKFLGLRGSTNSAQIIEPSPGFCAVMGGAGVTEVTTRSLVSSLHSIGAPSSRADRKIPC